MHKTYRVQYEWDIVHIRSEAREIARMMGFDEVDQARIVQAISELGRNVIHHAEEGEITLSEAEENGQRGIRIRVRDTGPGMPNLQDWKQGTGQSVGETGGLKSVDMLMDEMRQIPVDSGTCVEAIKWLKHADVENESTVRPQRQS
ncbi:ATP-binding protein [Staphylospora marina]|uniref:ATP-binding protein n=1 Tax=Staphylospora marina TaxID=2490858 RepID=UPI000F5BF362|nr:ATP-binding protein [Staphylospora marina]